MIAEDTVTGAYEALKSLKDALVSTGSEVNSAFSNLGSAQTYGTAADYFELMSKTHINFFIENLSSCLQFQ